MAAIQARLPTKTQPRLKLDMLHAFGALFDEDIKNCLHFLDDPVPKVLYPVGRHLGIRRLENNDMRFIKQQENMEKITAMAMSGNRHFLAVAKKLKNDTSAYIYFYEYKNDTYRIQKAVITDGDPNSAVPKEFTSLYFSRDLKHIGALTNQPSANVYDWQKRGKPLGYSSLSGEDVNKITLNPSDSHSVCTSGKKHLKFWQISDGQFKELSSSANISQKYFFTDHSWLDSERIVTCTDSGEIFILGKGGIIQSHSAFDDISLSAQSILPFSKGFFVGGDEGIIGLWVRKEENPSSPNESTDPFDFIRHWRLGKRPKMKIKSMAISPNEEYLAVGTDRNDLGICYVNSIGFGQEPKTGIEEHIHREVKYDIVAQGFHQGKIMAMDVCLQRPLIATCCQIDGTIRIWNYITMKCEMLTKFFVSEDIATGDATHPLLGLAFHPSGYYLAAGFADKLRIYHVLHDCLRPYPREFKFNSCKQLKFSHGGHMLAAVSKKKDIHILQAYTFETIATLYGPGGVINDLFFSPDDHLFGCSSSDGGMNVWNTLDFKRTPADHIQRSASYYAGHLFCNDKDHKDIVIAAGNENKKAILREIVDGIVKKDTSVLDAKFTSLSYVRSPFKKIENFVVGTNTGLIKIYGYPLGPEQLDGFAAHYGSVEKIRCSPDGLYVFSAGSDGAIFIYAVAEGSEELELKDHKEDEQKIEEFGELLVDKGLADVVMVKRADLNDYTAQVERHRTDIEDVEAKLKFKESEYKRELAEQLETAEKRRELAVNDEKDRREQLQEQKKRQDLENAEVLKKKEFDHQNALEELEQLYQKKLAIESEKYFKLEQTRLEIQQIYEKQMDNLRDQNEAGLEKLMDTFKGYLQKVHDEYMATKKRADELKMTYEEKLSQQEDEHEAEIKDLNAEHETLRKQIEMENSKLSEEKSVAEKDKDSAENENRMLKTDKENSEKEIATKDKRIQDYEQKNKILEREKAEAQEKTYEKEQKLYAYKLKIKDLQKFKHFLTTKATEMQENLQPKEEKIEELKKRQEQLSVEFDYQRGTMENLSKKMKGQEVKIIQLTGELEQERKTVKQKDIKINKMLNHIHETINRGDGEKQYAKEMIKMYEIYVKDANPDIFEKKGDPQTIDALSSQIHYLEKSMDTLHNSANQKEKRAQKVLKNRTNENIVLINELNKMKEERKNLEKSNAEEIRKLQDELMKKKHENRILLEGKGDKLEESKSSFMKEKGGSKYKERPITDHRKGKGSLMKGSPFQRNKVEEGQRIQELMAQLQENNDTILYQKLEIKRLKENISELVAMQQFATPKGYPTNEMSQELRTSGNTQMMASGSGPVGQSQSALKSTKATIPTGSQMERAPHLPAVKSKKAL